MRLVLWSLFGQIACGVCAAGAPADGSSWIDFRNGGQGVSDAADLPLAWSHKQNVAWDLDLPGYGQSTPAVWNDRVYVTAVDGPDKNRLWLLCLSIEDGSELWRKGLDSSRPQTSTDRTGRAAPSPAVDARGVYALFDSGDFAAFSHEGEPLWRQDLNEVFGPIRNGHDFGSSPRLDDGRIYIHVSHLGPSYVAALSTEDGTVLWKKDLPPEGGWNTPIAVDGPSGRLVLISRAGGLEALDADSGETAWSRPGEWSQATAIPSLTAGDGIAVVPSMNRGETFAVRLSAPEEALWVAERATNHYSSPLVYQGRVYLVNTVGVVFCLDLETGRELWAKRLGQPAWASTIAAGERLYFFVKPCSPKK